MPYLFAVALLSLAAAGCGSGSPPSAPAPTPTPTPTPVPTTPLAESADSYVRRDAAGQAWTIGNSRIAVTFGLTATKDMQLQSITTPSTGRSLALTKASDSAVTIDGKSITVGLASSGLTFEGATAASTEHGVRLDFTYSLPAPALTLVRHYACFSGAPVLETWTTYHARSSARVTVANQEVWSVSLPVTTVHHVSGLLGDSADGSEQARSPFLLQTTPVGGDRFSMGSERRSTEEHLPLAMVDSGTADEFFAGLLWSGSWQMVVEPGSGSRRMVWAIPGVSIAVDASRDLESPHAVFGFVPGRVGDVSAALRPFIDVGLRQGRGFESLVTANTWFAYGVLIDEPTVKREMEAAAALGAELFVLDAGWYRGAGTNGEYDYSTGVGSLKADPDRFPGGLRELREHAHRLGMKFGVWVEPERTDLARLEEADGPAEPWLARRDNRLNPDLPPGEETAGQICLGSREAREWLLEQLAAFIVEVEPDYLKWDNNFWVNCNRAGHDHGTSDGNYAHTVGLYWILDELRYRFPSLLIENVAGGGNRLDLGMLRYTDTAWMDDRTKPSPHVRHNLEGLSAIFPPAYLLSFVVDSDEEPLPQAFDLPLYMRSRMPGILGLTVRVPDYAPEDQEAMRREVAAYRGFRDIITTADARLLSGQVNSPSQPTWDVLQELSASSGDALIFAFQVDGGTPSILVRPVGLTKDAVYSVTTLDGRAIGTAASADLMADGIEIVESWETSAHVLVLRVNVEETRRLRARGRGLRDGALQVKGATGAAAGTPRAKPGHGGKKLR